MSGDLIDFRIQMNRVPLSCPRAIWDQPRRHRSAQHQNFQSLLSSEPHVPRRCRLQLNLTTWVVVSCDCMHLPKLAFLGQQLLSSSMTRTELQEARALAWEE